MTESEDHLKVELRAALDEVTREADLWIDVVPVLNQTIVGDIANCLIIFLGYVSTYSPCDQLNVALRGPSSSGKSYLVIEVGKLLPVGDQIKLAYASPMAFFHESGTWNNETKTIDIDLEKKALVFLDLPHDALMQRLRPLLSHDDKLLTTKIVDRREKHGLRKKKSTTLCDSKNEDHPTPILTKNWSRTLSANG